MSPAVTEGEARCDSMHIVKHMHTTHLLSLSMHLILNMAVIKVLLDAHDSLGILAVRCVHHKHSIEEAVVW